MELIDGNTYLVEFQGEKTPAVFWDECGFLCFELVGMPGCIDYKEGMWVGEIAKEAKDTSTQSGGSCNYYMVDVKKPTTLSEPYTIECNDLIESLGLSFKESNIVNEIFRTANERTHGNGKTGNTEKRAAEKILFFAIRHAISNGVDIESIINDINIK